MNEPLYVLDRAPLPVSVPILEPRIQPRVRRRRTGRCPPRGKSTPPYCCSARRPGHPRSVTASPAFSCLIGILCLVFFLRLIHLRTSCLINLSASHVFAFLHAAPRAGPSKQRARRLVRTLPSQRRWRFRQRRASWCMQQCHMCKCCFWGGSLHGARRAAKAGRGGAP